MRTIHLYLDREGNRFVNSIGDGNPLATDGLEVTKDDEIQFLVHNLARNTTVPALVPFVEKPLEFSAMRVSIGRRGAPARAGTFKLRVVDQTTAALAWPPDLSTPSLVAAWKVTVLNALKALSNVTSGGIVAEDPADAPGNWFYYMWTDPARTDVIELVENRLLPVCEFEQSGSLTPFGYAQLLEIRQFPVAMTSAFTRPLPPAVTVIETQLGAAGVNEEQVIVVPSTSTGAVAFVWSGAQTQSIAVAALTSSGIVASLNAIVPAGDSDPSFAVQDRPATEGKRFAVVMIGPLAGAAHAVIGKVMIDQESVPYAVGVLDLSLVKQSVKQALNGAPSAALELELVINESGEETVLHPITLLNDMTTGSTEDAAVGAGAVTVVTETVIVDNSTTEPFASVAPGATFSPVGAVGAGVAQVVDHALGTLNPFVRVDYEFSTGEWRPLGPGEMSYFSTDADHVQINIVYAISNTPGDDFYKDRFRVFISSPDAVLQIFADLKVAWSQCLESLPGGQTLVAKLAAIDAALGVVGGSLKVPAGNITGLLGVANIDMAALGVALKTEATFLDSLRVLVQDSTVVDNIGTLLQASTTFFTTLKTLITSDQITSVLAPALFSNNTFVTNMRTLIVEIIQGTAGALTDTVIWRLPDWNVLYPSATAGALMPLPAAVFLPADLGTLTGAFLPRPSPDNAGKRYTIGAGGARSRAALSPHGKKTFVEGDVVFSDGLDWYLADIGIVGTFTANFGSDVITVAGALVSGAHFLAVGDRVRLTTTTTLPAGLAVNTDYYVIAAGLTAAALKLSATLGGSAIDITDAGTGVHTMVTGAYYAAEFERKLFTIEVNDQELSLGTRFALPYTFSLGLTGNCEGYYRFTLLRGTPNATRVGNSNLASITVDEVVIDVPIILTDSLAIHSFGYAVERSLTNVLTATKQIYTKTDIAAVAPAAAKFTLMGLLSRFDLRDRALPIGQVKLTTPVGQIASIVKLEP